MGTRTFLKALAVVLAVTAQFPAAARAEADRVSADAPPKASTLETFSVRARYGVAYRAGGQTDQGPGMSYAGLTPNDLSLAGWVYFIDYLGLTAAFQREAFSLNDANGLVTAGSLYRVHAGPVGRVPLGPLRLEPYVAYAFHTLPIFGSTVSPAFAPVTRHGILLAARAMVDVGPVQVEGHFEYPLALSVVDPQQLATGASGLAAGGSVRLQILRTGKLWWGLAVDGSYVTDSVVGADGFVAKQELGRFGAAVDVKWQDPPLEPPRFGSVAVSLADADTGAPLPGEVVLEVGGGEMRLQADAAGLAAAAQLLPGAVLVKASMGGYLPAEAQGEVTAGFKVSLPLKLKKEAPKVGAVLVTVTEREVGKPLPGAAVVVGDKAVTTDDQGQAKVEGLPPGPVAIAVTLAGYTPGAEAAAVAAGKSAEVAVALVPEKKAIPATITGIIRSTQGGKRIAARLEIRELKLKVTAAADGTFAVRVPGGTYSVTISAAGYAAQTKSVVVKDGDQAIFNVDLHPR